MFIAVVEVDAYDSEYDVEHVSSEFFLCEGTGTKMEREDATTRITARYGVTVRGIEFLAGEAAEEYLWRQYNGVALLTTP